MDDLIKALTILRKYDNPEEPTRGSHGELLVFVHPEIVPDEDKAILFGLGFEPFLEEECFASYRFG